MFFNSKNINIETHSSELRDCQKQNAQRTTVCLLHEQTFSSFNVIITVNNTGVCSK